MALNKKTTATGKWLHLLTRMCGLTGALALLAGLFFSLVTDDAMISLGFFIAGGVAVVLALAVELRGVFDVLGSRRGAVGFNVLAQFVVVLVLVIGANVFSFTHYLRIDLTRDQQFTLEDKFRQQLLQLRGDTDIVVYYAHRSFGQTAETKQDNYDFAAARKIVEKIKDLAEQFQDLGPRFRVHVLDEQDKLKEKKFLNIKKNVSEKLADEILKAPENSIFLFSKEQESIQRISFSDIYHLDRQASIEKKNLVLQYQGVGPFARKVFNVEEKRPHVGLAVIHPLLGFQNEDIPFYTMSGTRKTLERYNFQTTDIMLKKLDGDGDLTDEPTILTYDESRFEQIEDELEDIKESLPKFEKDLKEAKELFKFWNESTLAELNKKYVYYFRQDGLQGITLRTEMADAKKSGISFKFIDVDDDDQKNRTSTYRQATNQLQGLVEKYRADEESLTKERGTLRVDQLMEKRRVSDLELKAKNLLANIDVLIVPRITIIDATVGQVIPNRVHRIEKAQLSAVKWFMKQGKGVLFLLGPTNEPREMPDQPGKAADEVEPMLREIGFVLPKQTVLFNAEMREFNERKTGVARFGKTKEKRKFEVPGLRLDETTSTRFMDKKREAFSPHAIRTSLATMNRALGAKESDEIRMRYSRPVYYVPPTFEPKAASGVVGSLAMPGFAGPLLASTHWTGSAWLSRAKQVPDDSAVFLVTREESWNEDHPFIAKDKVPTYSASPDDDWRKGTVEEVRRGPFPVGIAVEATLPSAWFEKDSETIRKPRIVVVGSGNAFVGTDLPPVKQRAFLDMVNWLAGRDDLLVRDVATWQYPRAEIGEADRRYWFGLAAALPVLCLYFGFMVLMVRNVR